MAIDVVSTLHKLSSTNLKNKNMVKKSGLSLEELLLSSSRDVLKKVESCLKNQELLRSLQLLYETFETNLEIDFSQDVIRGRKSAQDYLLTSRFKTLIKNEVSLGKMSKNDRVLFIGSGPFPVSAILYNQIAGCRVDCYEKVLSRVALANSALKKLGLIDVVKTFHKSGEELTSGKYDVVIVALLAKPKKKILKKLASVLKPGTRIICRTADGVNKFFYEETGVGLLSQFKVAKKMSAKKDQTISSLLLMK